MAKGTEKLFQTNQASEDSFGGSLGDNDPLLNQKSLSFFDWLDIQLPSEQQRGKGFYKWLSERL